MEDAKFHVEEIIYQFFPLLSILFKIKAVVCSFLTQRLDVFFVYNDYLNHFVFPMSVVCFW